MVLVEVGKPVAIGRRDTIPAKDFGIVGPLFWRAEAVRGIFPEFSFAGCSG